MLLGRKDDQMHNVRLTILFLFLSLHLEAQNMVFICNGTVNGKFHINKECGAIKNCGGQIKSITISEARKEGHLPCKRCSRNVVVHKLSTKSKVNTNVVEMARSDKGMKSQIIAHIGFTTSYNESWLIPNWVSYNLTKEKINGSIPRPKRSYEPDPMVKGKSAVHSDYSNSGYTRGHMAPAADMKWSVGAMNESFYLSNVCPQISELNGGVWEKLEKRIRALATESTVYICCGPIVSQSPLRIGENRIVVPDRFFKVICMQRKGKWQAVGFIFPNFPCKGSMFDYATSVDEVEKITGHDFFFNISDDIEASIESVWKMKDWQ